MSTHARLTSIMAAASLALLPASLLAQSALPRLEPADCGSFNPALSRDSTTRCSWFIAAEVRSKPAGRVVRLPVVVLKPSQPVGGPPLVMLHGGPGGPGGVRTITPQVLSGPLRTRRDMVIYDQRGAGLSQPVLCPRHADSLARLQWMESQEERREFWDEFARSCSAELRGQGIDPAAYNTTVNGEDLAELRQVLGIQKWDVYGGSYGGRLAQEIMRRDPEGVRSVILASSITRGPEHLIEQPLVVQRAFERIFAACATRPACQQAFPTLEADFYAVYEELERTPLIVQVERNGVPDTARLDGRRFVNRLRGTINRGRRRVPLLIHELRSGDRMRAARALVGDGAQGDATDAQVLNNLVHCYDGYTPDIDRRVDSVEAIVREPFGRKIGPSDCPLWMDRFADSADRAAVSSDIPTLILNGHFDDRTPPEHGRFIAANLSRAYVFVFPNEGHGGRPVGCHLSILQQFDQDPFTAPDGSCIEQIPPIEFFTSWEELTSASPPNPSP
jgi:pimeloyl-ACP methyl ester carboxylesterase